MVKGTDKCIITDGFLGLVLPAQSGQLHMAEIPGRYLGREDLEQEGLASDLLHA